MTSSSVRAWLREMWDDTYDIVIAFLIAMTAIAIFAAVTIRNEEQSMPPQPPTGVQVFDMIAQYMDPIGNAPAPDRGLMPRPLQEQQVP